MDVQMLTQGLYMYFGEDIFRIRVALSTIAHVMMAEFLEKHEDPLHKDALILLENLGDASAKRGFKRGE